MHLSLSLVALLCSILCLFCRECCDNTTVPALTCVIVCPRGHVFDSSSFLGCVSVLAFFIVAVLLLACLPVPARWYCMSLLAYSLRRVLSVPALAHACVSPCGVCLATALVLCLFSVPAQAYRFGVYVRPLVL